MPRVTADTHVLSAPALARLLAALDSDPDRAGHEYERLRASLIRFFDWRGAWPPDECADATLDRLSRKLQEDTAIDDVRAYARGIARILLRERLRGPVFAPLGEATAQPVPPVDEGAERRHACFDACLAALPDESRALVLAYYEGDRGGKIANRRRIAASAGLSDNALRSRVQRIRDRLERCVRDCTGSKAAES